MTARLVPLWLAGSDPAADWRQQAECIGEDPELFFPIGSGQHAEAQVAEAKQVCQRCPVVGRCRDFALFNGCEGVWGGLDDAERRLLRRRVQLSPSVAYHLEPVVRHAAHP